MKFKTFGLMAAIVGTFSISACSGQNEQSTKASGDTLRIATEGTYAPFNHTNPDGSLGGFDVDIANALCNKNANRMPNHCPRLGRYYTSIKTGKFDAIVAAMSVTPERSEQVDFSEPYFVNSLVFWQKRFKF